MLYLEQAVTSSEGQGMEAQQRERDHTWVNVLCLQIQEHEDVDGMEGLEKPTLGGHEVHVELLAWGHHGQL